MKKKSLLDLKKFFLIFFAAALEAKEKCGRLHRDISINNIILVRKDGELRIGILIDWELSCRSDRPDGHRNYARSVSVLSFDFDAF